MGINETLICAPQEAIAQSININHSIGIYVSCPPVENHISGDAKISIYVFYSPSCCIQKDAIMKEEMHVSLE